MFIVFLPVELFKWRLADGRGAAEPQTKPASAWFGAAGSFGPLLKGTAGADVSQTPEFDHGPPIKQRTSYFSHS